MHWLRRTIPSDQPATSPKTPPGAFEVETRDLRTIHPSRQFDVILLLSFLYRIEAVFGAMRRLSSWLVEHRTIYVETQVTIVKSDLPIFEYASGVYPTTAHQD